MVCRLKNMNEISKVKICNICECEYHSRRKTSITCGTSCSSKYRNKKYDVARKGGLKSAANQQRRSKNEIYFFELCCKYYKNVKHNVAMFNGWDADIVIEDLKCAVLWNGAWHYKQISKSQSLSQIQNRDRLKLIEINKCGYFPYVIVDMGKYDAAFVEFEFNKFVAGWHSSSAPGS